MSKPAKYALTVLAAPELRAEDKTLLKLQQAAVALVASIADFEAKAALSGILAGLTLHRVKASMPGTFRAWLEGEDKPGKGADVHRGGHFRVGKTQANNYMRLATAFLEKTKAKVPDLLALPGDQLSLDIADSAGGKRLADKLQGFIGGKSLNELLVAYGIKGVTRASDDEGGDNGGGATPAGEDFFAEVATSLEHWRKIVTSKDALVRLSPAQLDTLRDSVSADYAEFQKLYKAVRGKTANAE